MIISAMFARGIIFIWGLFFLGPIYGASYPCSLALQDLVRFEQMRDQFIRFDREHPEQQLSEKIRIVALIVIVRDGEILLGKRKNGVEEGSIGVVGGKFDEEDESLLDAALRELREETGLEVGRSRLRFLRSIAPHFAEDGYYYSPYVYLLRLGEGEEPRVMEPDKIEGEWEWFDPKNLPEPLFSTNRRLFRDEDFLESLELSSTD